MKLKHLFFWLSGAGTEILSSCQKVEQRKYVAIGATVLVPTVFAFVAASFTVSTLNDNTAIMIAMGCLWAFIIMSIDRALLAGYRAFTSLWVKIGQLLVRVLIAAIIGMTISHPVVLYIFHEAVELQIKEDHKNQVKELRKELDDKKANIDKELEELRQKKEEISKDDGIQKSSTNSGAGAYDDNLKAIHASLEAAAKADIDKLREQRALLFADREKFRKLSEDYLKLLEKEAAGKRVDGKAGKGPRWHQINNDQYLPILEQIKNIDNAIAGIDLDIKHRRDTLEKKKQEQVDQYNEKMLQSVAEAAEQESKRRASYEQGRQKTIEELENKIGESKANYDNDIQKLEKETEEHISDLKTHSDKPDLLSLSIALHKIWNKEPFALIAYIFIVLTFSIVDVAPVLIKFLMKPSEYDYRLERAENRYEMDNDKYKKNYPALPEYTTNIKERINSDLGMQLDIEKGINQRNLADFKEDIFGSVNYLSAAVISILLPTAVSVIVIHFTGDEVLSLVIGVFLLIVFIMLFIVQKKR